MGLKGLHLLHKVGQVQAKPRLVQPNCNSIEKELVLGLLSFFSQPNCNPNEMRYHGIERKVTV